MYKIFHFKSLTSTQDKAKELSKKGISNAVIIADTQTKGYGRLKRKWHSGKNGLCMSILLNPKNTEKLQYLTFIAAISAVESIKKISKLKASIKWPNDVHYKGKKLCGILTEGVFGKNNFVVVGIGMNVNQTKFPVQINDTAASLRTIKHRIFGIKDIMYAIINEFFHLYRNYYNKNKLNYIMNLWKKNSDTIGKDVTVVTRAKEIRGKAVGIGKDCSLILKLNNKTIKIVEGDLRIRYSRPTK